MKLIAYFPDEVMRLEGIFHGGALAQGQPALVVGLGRDHPEINSAWKAGGLAFLSPLALLVDAETNAVLFNPRNALLGMEQWSRDFLDQHPSWPNEIVQDL